MNIAAKIIFICLVAFGCGNFLLDFLPLGFAAPTIWGVAEVGGYIVAALGVLLSVLGAVGLAIKRNTKFWASFQPVNVGLLIALWSGMVISKVFSWMVLVIAVISFMFLLYFIWRHIVKWRVIPISLILFSLITSDIRTILPFFHLATAVILILIPIGLMLEQLHASFHTLKKYTK